MDGKPICGELKIAPHWKIGIVTSRFNEAITVPLEEGAICRFLDLGGQSGQVIRIKVPGALEIPMASRWLFESGCDAVVALGAVIRGETTHYEVVCEGFLRGCMEIQKEAGKPLSFGVLTVENRAQALARVGGDKGHKGVEAVDVAIEMLNLQEILSIK